MSFSRFCGRQSAAVVLFVSLGFLGCADDRPVWQDDDESDCYDGCCDTGCASSGSGSGSTGSGVGSSSTTGGSTGGGPTGDAELVGLYAIQLSAVPGEVNNLVDCHGGMSACEAQLGSWRAMFKSCFESATCRANMKADTDLRFHYIGTGTAYPGPTLDDYKSFGAGNIAGYCGVRNSANIGALYEFQSQTELWLSMEIASSSQIFENGSYVPVEVEQGDVGPGYFCVVAQGSFKFHWIPSSGYYIYGDDEATSETMIADGTVDAIKREEVRDDTETELVKGAIKAPWLH